MRWIGECSHAYRGYLIRKRVKTVMLAFDHGYFQGPTTGLERIDINIAPLFEHADVLMCTRGILRSVVPPATQ
ncbi:putative aldolase [Escherichia coli]|nr:putative aldolase [Escherichia coli]